MRLLSRFHEIVLVHHGCVHFSGLVYTYSITKESTPHSSLFFFSSFFFLSPPFGSLATYINIDFFWRRCLLQSAVCAGWMMETPTLSSPRSHSQTFLPPAYRFCQVSKRPAGRGPDDLAGRRVMKSDGKGETGGGRVMDRDTPPGTTRLYWLTRWGRERVITGRRWGTSMSQPPVIFNSPFRRGGGCIAPLLLGQESKAGITLPPPPSRGVGWL